MNEKPDKRPSIPPMYDKMSIIEKFFFLFKAKTSFTAKFILKSVISFVSPYSSMLKESCQSILWSTRIFNSLFHSIPQKRHAVLDVFTRLIALADFLRVLKVFLDFPETVLIAGTANSHRFIPDEIEADTVA
jgi:hypothetical protein